MNLYRKLRLELESAKDSADRAQRAAGALLLRAERQHRHDHRRWRSREFRGNCFWWVCRQLWRRGGYLTARKIDVAYGNTVAVLLTAAALFSFALDWPVLGLLFALHAPLFLFHFGWRPKHGRRLYHFRPADAATQVPWITLRGYIQRGEDDECH